MVGQGKGCPSTYATLRLTLTRSPGKGIPQTALPNALPR